jgi:hypothetical protein
MSNLDTAGRIAHEREILATLIAECEGIATPLPSCRHLIGFNKHGHLVALVWHGSADPELSGEDLDAVQTEAATLQQSQPPLHVWSGLCRHDDGEGWLFYHLTPYMLAASRQEPVSTNIAGHAA